MHGPLNLRLNFFGTQHDPNDLIKTHYSASFRKKNSTIELNLNLYM